MTYKWFCIPHLWVKAVLSKYNTKITDSQGFQGQSHLGSVKCVFIIPINIAWNWCNTEHFLRNTDLKGLGSFSKISHKGSPNKGTNYSYH